MMGEAGYVLFGGQQKGSEQKGSEEIEKRIAAIIANCFADGKGFADEPPLVSLPTATIDFSLEAAHSISRLVQTEDSTICFSHNEMLITVDRDWNVNPAEEASGQPVSNDLLTYLRGFAEAKAQQERRY